MDDLFSLESLEDDFEIPCAPWNSADWPFSMDGGGTAHIISSVFTTPDETSTAASINDLMIETSLSDQISNRQPEPVDNGLQHLFSPQSSASKLDHGLHLSLLQHELSKQLFKLKSMPWDITQVMRLTCMHDASDDLANHSQADLETNHLAKIANTSAAFVRLLCSVQNPMAHDGNEVRTNKSPQPSIHPRLSVAELLTILSCHMLIISIYDFILSHFTEQALHNPGAINNLMQSAPKLFLGGIAVAPRLKLLSHLLYCLIEGQLRPIEMLLGLPEEFSIALKRNVAGKENRTGLFSGQGGQLLFSTLMKMGNDSTSEVRSGLGGIESLREKIKVVQSLE